jgi:hypothetical protein
LYTQVARTEVASLSDRIEIECFIAVYAVHVEERPRPAGATTIRLIVLGLKAMPQRGGSAQYE